MGARHSMKKTVRLFCFAVILMLVSSIGASLLQSDFGKTEIIPFKIPTADGRWLSGTIFKPKAASAENPLPAVVTCHGYLNNSQMQDLNAIELSRRNMTVIAMDAYGHGKSADVNAGVMEETSVNGIGMIPMVEYVWNLDYVDRERIGVIGHSMGGMAVWCTLMYYGAQYNAAIEGTQTEDSDGGAQITAAEWEAADAVNKVAAGMPTSFIQFSTEDTFQMIHANLAMNSGKYDEGCYGNASGDGDLSGDAPESLEAVNSIMPEGEKVDSVEIGKYYGNAEDKTLRVIFNPPEIHPGQHFSTASAGYAADFFETAFGTDSGLDAGNQLWLLKEIFNGIGLIGILMAIVPMGLLLLEVPVFRSLKGEAPAPMNVLNSKKSRLIFWGGWALSWIISGLSFFPISKLDSVFFPAQTNMAPAKWFPQPSTNFIMLWAVFNGIVGVILFWISCRISGKEQGRKIDFSDIKIGILPLVKTIALALCIFAGFYGFVFVSEYFFNTDYRFWVMGICTFTPDKLMILLEYIPFYLIYYIVLSISNNKMSRIGGQREGVNILLCGLANVLGILLINGAQYIKLFATGTALFKDDRLYPMVVIPLIVWLFAAAYVGRKFYKATGKIWLGALVNCLIIVMIGVANTATLQI